MYTSPATQSSPLSDLKLPALRCPTRGHHRTVHLRIESLEVIQKLQKEFIPLHYRVLVKYRGCRRHISTRLVRDICELQPFKSLLKGRISTGYKGGQIHRRFEDIKGSVRLPPKNPKLTVRGDKRQPLAIQVHVLYPCLLHSPIAWLCLPIEREIPQGELRGQLVAHRERIAVPQSPRWNLLHQREALSRKLPEAGEETLMG